MGVLGCGELAGVGDKIRDVTSIYRVNGTKNAVLLDTSFYPAPSAYAGGIYQGYGLFLVGEGSIQGVPSGTRHFAYNGPLLPKNGVD